MKTGIFGGTFAPIHKGHIGAALEFLKQFELDTLYIIPDRIPPHKSVDSVDDPFIRYEMTRLGFCDNPLYSSKIIVSDMEIKREGKSYTRNTLDWFSEHGMNDLYLLCGTDMLLGFDTWHRFTEIFELCKIVYVIREKADESLLNKIGAKVSEYENKYSAKIYKLNYVPVEISSTEIRKIIKDGGDVSQFVPEKVYDFIKEKGLYK